MKTILLFAELREVSSILSTNMEFPRSAILVLLLHLLLLNLAPKPAYSELILEHGYTIKTVLEGDKLDSEISRFSGHVAGFSDGDRLSALFDRPRSFAVDSKGTIYVADKNNRAIRKISGSGVTTIAGGYSKKPGRIDGPAQNASFSDDFDLVFVPKTCALLISDRGNRMVRQMNLKPEDCAHESQLELGMPMVSVIGVLYLLIGLLAGFVARPFLVSHDTLDRHSFDKIWKHCQIILGKRLLTICSDIKSAIAISTPYMLMGRLVCLSLSNLSLMFRVHRPENHSLRREPIYHCLKREPISLLDLDSTSNQCTSKSQIFADPLKDLMSLGAGFNALDVNKSIDQGEEKHDVSTYSHGKVDDMIQASISAFDNQAKREGSLPGFSLDKSGLVQEKVKNS
ncbi:uncharacterized protein LOC143856152 isoform X2 [Tasmannia lanceolata]|uniref:uncharacterized protein LOC143856152 isoform X2 n=1 Tax=Tasmannia lanceolata TaxID=3420 RepID=UPI004062CDE7